MIYASKERAQAVAAQLVYDTHGFYRAARIAEGWTVRVFSPYSNGDVLEWAPEVVATGRAAAGFWLGTGAKAQ